LERVTLGVADLSSNPKKRRILKTPYPKKKNDPLKEKSCLKMNPPKENFLKKTNS
jgi:hypothetical protein